MMRVAAFVFLTLALLNCVSAFSVSGNKLLDANGNEVLLRGVVRPSFEWNWQGENANANDYRLMASWGANVVRITINQDFWLSGSATYQSGYKGVIQTQLTNAKAAGLAVIFDLHWSDQGNLQIGKADQQNMADLNSITFWADFAKTFKNDPAVMFELYNEPHDVSWSVWLNGGTASTSGTGWAVAGMQQMYNAIRTTAGASNVVIVSGLNWAFDLSGVGNGYAVSGTNIMYSTHPYNYDGKKSGNWDAAFGYLTATYPVIMSEFGQYCANDGYVDQLLTYANTKKIHWTAWAWYVNGCSFPSIINDWNGTPSDPVGKIVKNYLSATASTKSPTSAPTVAPTIAPTKAPNNTATTTTTKQGATTTTTKAATTTTTKAPTTKPGATTTTTQSGSGCAMTVTVANNMINFNNVGTKTIKAATVTVTGTMGWSNLVLVSGTTYRFPDWENALTAGTSWNGGGYQGTAPTFSNISPSC